MKGRSIMRCLYLVPLTARIPQKALALIDPVKKHEVHIVRPPTYRGLPPYPLYEPPYFWDCSAFTALGRTPLIPGRTISRAGGVLGLERAVVQRQPRDEIESTRFQRCPHAPRMARAFVLVIVSGANDEQHRKSREN